MQKANIIHMLIAEVHPFDDGSGRMNSELFKANKSNIIITTVLKGFLHQENSNRIN